MSDVKISKESAVAKKEAPPPALRSEFFAPTFRFGRFFGLSPFGMMREFTEEMNRLVQGVTPANGNDAWIPTTDVVLKNGDLIVTAELPGLEKDDVKVELADNVLVIEGERKCEKKEVREGFEQTERSYGHFYRAVPLPDGAKTDLAKAELKDGILKVTVPVPGVKKNFRKIPVEQPKPKAA